MLDPQLGSNAHASVCMQQAPTMHCEHGVPPGSVLHMPPSPGGGMPQKPPLHVRPMQHCAFELHVEPGGKQLPLPQRLF